MAAFLLSSSLAQPGAASVSRASPGAGRKIVATMIYAAVQRVTGNAAMTVVLRDGASGVGAIMMAIQLAGATSVPEYFSLSGLSLIGSAGAAMTLEFTAGSVNYNTAVSLAGYEA